MTEGNETFFLHNPSEEINAQYSEEIGRYLTAPCPACTRDNAIKLLKKFARTQFKDFWFHGIAEYLPAVSEGTMKLKQVYYPHDDAILYARELIATLDPRVLARDFLYGLAHNAPEYRTALACYYYIHNLPDHAFQKKYVGWNGQDVYSDVTCEICSYTSGRRANAIEEPKMDFWHINVDMDFFYLKASIPLYFDLNTAILFLEEYRKQPRPKTDASDLAFFHSVIAEIEAAPEDTTPATLRKILKSNILKCMTVAQIEAFIDMLGHLHILHPPGAYGVTEKHTCQREMTQPESMRTYFAYPVYNWKRKHGIDYASINRLFADLYEVGNLL